MNLEGVDRPLAPFSARAANVSARREIGPYVILTVNDRSGPRPIAGQFYMLRAAERWGGGEDGRPYLPRALSYARCQEGPQGIELDFLFESVGPGTERLAELVAGDQLIVTGPFGNGFAIADDADVVLVAGGIGLAPIVALADSLTAAGRGYGSALIGMRSAAHASAISAYGLEHQLTTDDGSAGRQGFVSELLSERLNESAAAEIYACGPPAMLESVRSICQQRGASAQLAMESGMACGFGACYGCVVPTRDGYLRLCVDGPVIDAARLESALLPRAGH